jgi:hypothetical protein
VPGLLERLGIRHAAGLLRIPPPGPRRHRIGWDRIDVRDPAHPRLRGTLEQVNLFHLVRGAPVVR